MTKSKRQVITDGKLPERTCPRCGAQVLKAIIHGKLSYDCTRFSWTHWGPWDESVRIDISKDSKPL